MRVGINLFRLREGSGGILGYAIWLAKALSKHPEVELTLINYESSREIESLFCPASTKDLRILPNLRHLKRSTSDLDLVWHINRHAYPRLKTKSVAFLPDCIDTAYPNFFSKKDLKQRQTEYKLASKNCNCIVTPSEFSRSVLDSVTGKSCRIEVIPHCLLSHGGLEELKIPFEKASYLLYPANNWPHKNHVRLIEALAELRDRGRPTNCILTGFQDLNFTPIEKYISQFGLSGTIQHLGHVSTQQLHWLYQHARCLVYPSLQEGFGIPLLEAFASRLPVCCSNASSLPEVAGTAALYFDPESSEAIANQLEVLLSNQKLSQVLVESGHKQLMHFSEEAILKRHIETIKKLVC